MITMPAPKLHEKIDLEVFGTTKIYVVNPEKYYKFGNKWKPVWNTTTYSIKAYKIIKQLFPYLKIKIKQAQVAFAFQDGKKAYMDHLGLPKEEVDFRENLYQEMKKLNRRGKEIAKS